MNSQQIAEIEEVLIKKLQGKASIESRRYWKYFARIILKDLIEALDEKGFEIVKKVKDDDVSDR